MQTVGDTLYTSITIYPSTVDNYLLIGVEKNNDMARRNFFHFDAPRASRRKDDEVEVLREKWQYNKIDNEYWESGIFEKRHRAATQ